MLSVNLLEHYRQLSQRSLTIVDVETTGSRPYNSRITEISVLQASLAEGIRHQQTTLVNPQTFIPAKITEITGISQAMVATAPTAAEVLPAYLPLLRSGVMTAHNLEFDYSFLRMEATRIGKALVRSPQDQLCTVQLSRLLLADLRSRSLPYLVKHFQFPIDTSHRAEADTLACWFLAKHLLTEICEQDDSLLLDKFARQWISLKDAARILNCSPTKAQRHLEDHSAEHRWLGRGRNQLLVYRRGDVENLFYEYQQSIQQSLF
jgi:DNA polymerase-3 subunit epsilon